LLRQVFTNLLGNGFKYSASNPQPRVRVYATIIEGAVRVSVADNGMGFAPECAQRIFDPFTRVTPGASEGFGVGLTIVKNIIVRHGGSVWAEGAVGHGATIHLELPLEAPSRLPILRNDANQAQRCGSNHYRSNKQEEGFNN
jgi:signal transduction histidine kinase